MELRREKGKGNSPGGEKKGKAKVCPTGAGFYQQLAGILPFGQWALGLEAGGVGVLGQPC